ncbi:MAG: DUF1893 domain-containing protein [Spirochaetales bacterium]|nr:DUF1893 domain-containing protein [Spirochaetales bacterium]
MLFTGLREKLLLIFTRNMGNMKISPKSPKLPKTSKLPGPLQSSAASKAGKPQKQREASLMLFYNSKLIYSSTGKWLYPLFELETFLVTQPFNRSELTVEDKIIGKAAALILIKFGIKNIHAHLLSGLGREMLDKYKINYTYGELVDKILCKTEDLLKHINDPDTAYNIIRERVSSLQKT